ncbi:tetratricopeptide repeat protein [Gemmatimonadota bacterium]
MAEREANRAIEEDSTNAEAYAVLGDVRMIRWDWLGAEEAFRRAIDLRPSYATAHQWYSILLVAQGRIEEALTEGQIAVEVNPRVGGSLSGQAIRLLNARRYDEALSLFDESLSLSASSGLITRLWASLAYALSGQSLRAIELAQSALEAGADSVTYRGLLAGIHSLAGDVDLAQEILRDLEDLHTQRLTDGESVPPSTFWPAYAVMGDLDPAFAWLEEDVKEGSWGTVYLGVSPLVDPLRSDPRYQTALDQIGLGHLKERFDSLAGVPPSGGT